MLYITKGELSDLSVKPRRIDTAVLGVLDVGKMESGLQKKKKKMERESRMLNEFIHYISKARERI